MYGYENVSFVDRLPDDFIQVLPDTNRLKEIKNSIDKRLKALENKLYMSNALYARKIINEERAAKHLKTGIYFSPTEHFGI